MRNPEPCHQTTTRYWRSASVGLNTKVAGLESRTEVEKVNARLEQAALTTARALQEISGHWDAVYEAMRRAETEPSVPDAGSFPPT